jgi:hypothetical protein
MSKPVSFYSEGLKLAADLLLPADVKPGDRSDSGILPKLRRSNVQRHASSIAGAPFQRTNEEIQSQQLREKHMSLVAKISTSGERFSGDIPPATRRSIFGNS